MKKPKTLHEVRVKLRTEWWVTVYVPDPDDAAIEAIAEHGSTIGEDAECEAIATQYVEEVDAEERNAELN